MKIQLTNEKCLIAWPQLNHLGEVIREHDGRPARQSYRLSKILRKVLEEIREYEKERERIFAKHKAPDVERTEGMTDEEFEAAKAAQAETLDKNTGVPKENVKAFMDELRPILDEKVEIDGVAPLVASEFDAAGVGVPIEIWDALGDMAVESEPADAKK